MTDLEKAEKEVRDAYMNLAIYYQQANASYSWAPVEKRAEIAMTFAETRGAVEQRIVDAEAKLKEAYELHNL